MAVRLWREDHGAATPHDDFLKIGFSDTDKRPFAVPKKKRLILHSRGLCPFPVPFIYEGKSYKLPRCGFLYRYGLRRYALYPAENITYHHSPAFRLPLTHSFAPFSL